ncbi:myosin-16 isoform X1 [Arachis hypogaea]|nr:myosin-16 [Arachis hypogaea]
MECQGLGNLVDNKTISVEAVSNVVQEEPSSTFQEEPSNASQEEPSCTIEEEMLNAVQEELTITSEHVERTEAIRESHSPLQGSETVEVLIEEIKKLKVMLQAEKVRADECERKYVEAQGSSEELRKKLAETEKRVYQLQESLNRMISSMSSQVADLKMILSTSSRLSSTFRPIARVDVASSNSDTSSTDSDFTFPASGPNSDASSKPGHYPLVVQDVTGEDGSGSESEREGSFDDYF